MEPIKSIPNPYSSFFLNKVAEKRNQLCQDGAKVICALGVLAGTYSAGALGVTISAIPLAVTALAFITALVAYKVFTFIRDINITTYSPSEMAAMKSMEWSGKGHLHNAAVKGQVMMTRLLLFMGADPCNTSAGLDTPLHLVCSSANQPNSKDHIKVMELLVKAGANVNAPGNCNRCPLHYAVEARHVDRVEFLAQNDAFINFKQSYNPDWSPLEHAEIRKQHQPSIGGKILGDPRSDQELLEADKRIYEILSTKGKVFIPQK